MLETLTTIFGVLIPLSLIGYMISKGANEDPQGLIKYEQLSAAVSKNPTWHLPIVIIGVLMSFIINLLTNIVLYALFAVMFILSRVVDLLKWIVEIIKWIYTNILIYIWELIKKITMMLIDLVVRIIKIGVQMISYIIEVIVMAVKIGVRYLVTIPLDILIAVINGVSGTLNLNFYYRTAKVLAIASLAAGLLMFIGHIVGQEVIGQLGSPFILAIALTYVVGMVAFDSKDSGKKAAMFALSVSGLIIGIMLLLFTLNQLDGISSWGGVFAGLWYAPSVLSITLVTILLITVVFITNVGAIYINTDGANLSFQDKLKGSIAQSFNRSYSFILQPAFSLAIGTLIVAIPYFLLNNSAQVLKDSIVGPIVSSNGESLAKDLEKNQIKVQQENLTNNSEISQSSFDSSIVNLGTELELETKISENKRYDSYLSSAITNGISFGIVPILSAKSIQDEIDKSRDEMNSLTNEKAEALKTIEEEIIAAESLKSEQMAKSDTALLRKDTTSANYYTEQATVSGENIEKLKMKLDRTEQFMAAHILGIDARIKYQGGNSLRYNLTYLLFLLGGGILSAVLIAFLANIYASSVKPVYEMWKSSFIADQVKEARSKNPLQPWIGIILIAFLFGGSLLSNINSEFPKFKELTDSVSINNNREVSNDPSDIASPQTEETDDPEEESVPEEQTRRQEETTVTDTFTCSDGKVIPSSYLMDGGCDCESCEDEGLN